MTPVSRYPAELGDRAGVALIRESATPEFAGSTDRTGDTVAAPVIQCVGALQLSGFEQDHPTSARHIGRDQRRLIYRQNIVHD